MRHHNVMTPLPHYLQSMLKLWISENRACRIHRCPADTNKNRTTVLQQNTHNLSKSLSNAGAIAVCNSFFFPQFLNILVLLDKSNIELIFVGYFHLRHSFALHVFRVWEWGWQACAPSEKCPHKDDKSFIIDRLIVLAGQ